MDLFEAAVCGTQCNPSCTSISVNTTKGRLHVKVKWCDCVHQRVTGQLNWNKNIVWYCV